MKTVKYQVGDKYGLNVALVTDVHDKPSAKILSSLSAAKPDVICLVGDMVHRSCLSKSENTKKFLSECPKIAPTLFSLGNHDYYMADEDIETIKSMGVKVLVNDQVTIGGVVFGGFPSLRRRSEAECASARSWVEKFKKLDGYKVLLCHHPEYYDRYDLGKNIDLVLSGHAHGGQIRLFGRGWVATGQGLFPKYTKGIYHGKLIVSTGLANTGGIIPRLFNETEIVYISI